MGVDLIDYAGNSLSLSLERKQQNHDCVPCRSDGPTLGFHLENLIELK